MNILQQQLSGFRTQTDVTSVLLDHISQADVDLILPVTQQECKALFKHHLDALRILEKNSLQIRHKEMEVCANIESKMGDRQKKLLLDKLCSSEAHADMYRTI